MSAHVSNAKVEATMLGTEGHGIFTAYLSITQSGTGQSFGGFALDAPPQERAANARRLPHAACGAFIAGVLRALHLEKWEDVRGALIRVRRDSPYGRITAIGHIIDEDWFDPFAELQQEAKP